MELIIIFVIAIIVYLFAGWKQFRNVLKAESIFDILIISDIGSLLVGRLIGYLIDINYYLSFGWSLNPLVGEIDMVWGNFMPWSFFNMGDGRFSITGIIIGFVFMINILFVNSNQKKSIYLLLDKIFVAILYALLALIIIFTALDYQWLGRNMVLVIGAIVQILIIIVWSKKFRDGYVSLLIYFGFAVMIMIRDLINGLQSISYDMVIAFSLLLFGIIQYLALKYKNRGDIIENELDYRGGQILRRQGQVMRKTDVIQVARVDRVTQKLDPYEKIKLIIKGERRKRK